ncbi:MAG TPA: amidase [Thermoanaerobaculia bacterium]|nr:amidase [Thermoanaerobaculia bacterium]
MSIVFATATAQAAAIRDKEISAVELVDAHLTQVERHNGSINAVVSLDADRARERARAADEALARGEVWGPLHGVPFTVKDTFETEGLCTTSSYEPLANHVPERDATVVRRMKDAGAILLGKTNLPLLATDFQTESPIFGRTNNPWNTDRTPGGSSGGSAAAVAAGMSSLDIGSDLGGSIRVPAAYCGVFGFKPSERRVSGRGHIPDWGIPGGSGPRRTVRHLGTYGPLARSLPDLRLVFDVIAGPDGAQVDIPPLPLREARAMDRSKIRLAWTTDVGGLPVHRGTREALAGLAQRLADGGVEIEEVESLGIDFSRSWRCWGQLAGAEVGAPLPGWLRQGMRLQFRLMPGSAAVNTGVVRGAGLGLKEYLEWLAVRDELTSSVDAAIGRLDGWLMPATLGPAFAHQKAKPLDIDGSPVPYFLASGTACTSVFNVAGNPAVVLPAGRSEDGLPLAAQLVGRRWRDEDLLDVAAHLAPLLEPWEPPPDLREGR